MLYASPSVLNILVSLLDQGTMVNVWFRQDLGMHCRLVAERWIPKEVLDRRMKDNLKSTCEGTMYPTAEP